MVEEDKAVVVDDLVVAKVVLADVPVAVAKVVLADVPVAVAKVVLADVPANK